MGGHGGLNILPQKRWNVYNFDNREKVKKDEEEAAKEEQIKREQSRRRDTEFRIQQLRQSRGLPSSSQSTATAAAAESPEPPQPKETETEPKSKHINLFEGIRIFDPIDNNNKNDNKKRDSLLTKEYKKMKKEEAKAVPVSAEDEKYRLGYGLAGKGVKLPWYLMEKQQEVTADARRNDSDTAFVSSEKKKKSVSELREERLKREAREKKRQQALITKTRRL